MTDLLFADVEARLGRPLSESEKHLDLIGINADLERGKAELHAAIQAEIRRSIGRWLKSHDWHLRLTPRMTRALNRLYRAGREHAKKELVAMGYPLRELQFETNNEREERERRLAKALRDLLAALTGINVRIDREARGVGLEMEGDPNAAVRRAIEKRVPGAMAAAADLVSTAFDNGLAGIFEQHQDLIPCWEYSAVMDGATCIFCAEEDGREFESLADLYVILPNFGPNPRCLGNGRCRCRGVPCMASEAAAKGIPLHEQKPSGLLIPQPQIFGDDAQASQLEETMNAALAELDRVLNIRSMHELRAIPILRSSGQDAGGYSSDIFGHPVQIEINGDITVGDQYMSVFHEFAHYLDQQAIGQAEKIGDGEDGWGSLGNVGPDWPAEVKQDLQAVFQALYDTRAAEVLNEMRDWNDLTITLRTGNQMTPEEHRRYLGYVLSPQEMFARAVAQWLIQRNGDPDDAMFEAQQSLDALTMDAMILYPQGWDYDDFDPARAALETLFEHLGWLR